MKIEEKIRKNNSCSIEELRFFHYIKQIFPSALYRHRFYFNEDKKKFTEVDIFIPELSFAVEYDGARFHNTDTSILRDIIKNDIIYKNNINLIRIRDKNLPIFNINKEFRYERKSKKSFKECISNIFTYIFSNYQVDKNIKDVALQLLSETIHFDLSFVEFVQKICFEKSLAFLNKELVDKEWNYEKNGFLKPENFTPGSAVEVWWKCDKGHEYQKNICDQTRKNKRGSKGNGCPYCSGNKVDKSNSLTTLNPKLASEWHLNKNGILTPNDVTIHSDKKVWWLCPEHEHSYDATISNRTKGGNCPYCSGMRVDNTNSLSVLNSKLASEWHPIKNRELTPEIVTLKSEKLVWWQCKKCGCEWEAKIATRSIGFKKCKICFPSPFTICDSNSLENNNKYLSSEWHPTLNGILTPSTVTYNSWTEVWWKCSKCGNEWKTKVSDRNKGKKKCKGCLPKHFKKYCNNSLK